MAVYRRILKVFVEELDNVPEGKNKALLELLERIVRKNTARIEAGMTAEVTGWTKHLGI